MTVKRIQFRRGTSAEWDTANTILAAGEPGYETDTGKSKTGSGTTPWKLLDYDNKADLSELTSGFPTGASVAHAFYAESFGAAGDGKTDDTDAIQRAVDAASNTGGGVVYLTAGRSYFLNSFVELKSNVTVDGQGAHLYKFDGCASYTNFGVLSHGATGYGSGAKNVGVRNIILGTVQQDGSVLAGHLLAMNHASGVLVENCVVTKTFNTTHAVDAGGCQRVVVRDCVFYGSAQTDEASEASRNETIQMDISDSGTAALADDPGSYDGLPSTDFTIERCEFRAFTKGSVTYQAESALGAHSPVTSTSDPWYARVRFVNNYVEAPQNTTRKGGCVHFFTAQDVTIRDNTFVGSGTSVPFVGFYAGAGQTYSENVHIAGNTFMGSQDSASNVVFLSFVDGAFVENNRFFDVLNVGIHAETARMVFLQKNVLKQSGTAGTDRKPIAVLSSVDFGLIVDNFHDGFDNGIQNSSSTVTSRTNVKIS